MLSDPISKVVIDNPRAQLLFEPLDYFLGRGDISVFAAKNSLVFEARFPDRAS
jgi:hypothetical protein